MAINTYSDELERDNIKESLDSAVVPCLEEKYFDISDLRLEYINVPQMNDFVPMDHPVKMLEKSEPVMPDSIKIIGNKATIWLRVLVDLNGDVLQTQIISSGGCSENILDYIREAARQCSFKPAYWLEQPIIAWSSAFEFVLKNNE